MIHLTLEPTTKNIVKGEMPLCVSLENMSEDKKVDGVI